MVVGRIIGVAAVQRVLDEAEDRALSGAEKGMARAVKGGEAIVKAHASGRPGPRVVTGDFRRSIVGEWQRGGAGVVGQIGTNAAQALRLEYGFYGPDRLGRVYAQPPYPYMQPSVPEVEALAVSEISSAIAAAF